MIMVIFINWETETILSATWFDAREQALEFALLNKGEHSVALIDTNKSDPVTNY